jgi:hypothetical protein
MELEWRWAAGVSRTMRLEANSRQRARRGRRIMPFASRQPSYLPYKPRKPPQAGFSVATAAAGPGYYTCAVSCRNPPWPRPTWQGRRSKLTTSTDNSWSDPSKHWLVCAAFTIPPSSDGCASVTRRAPVCAVAWNGSATAARLYSNAARSTIAAAILSSAVLLLLCPKPESLRAFSRQRHLTREAHSISG